MNPPESRTTLTQALAALRDDLAAQQPPPSVLTAARQVGRQAARQAAPGVPQPAPRPTGPLGHAETAAPQPRVWNWWRLAGRTGWGPKSARGAWSPSGAWSPWGAWAGAATCAAVLGVSVLLVLRPPQMAPARETLANPGPGLPAPDVLAAQVAQAAQDAQDVRAAQVAAAQPSLTPAMHFVPLVSPERMRALTASQGLSNGGAAGADTPAWVLTTELPQQRLAAMGLPYDPGRAAEPLRAELLVAGNGEVLAVRLIF